MESTKIKMCDELNCDWLPKLVLMSDFGNNWEEYYEYLYKSYLKDFKDEKNKPFIFDKEIRTRKHPEIENKDQTFFHITSNKEYSQTDDENDRLPDLRRCERIKWPRKIIENYNCNKECPGCKKIKLWKENYRNNERIYILFENFRYIVILEEREEYVLFITAFYIEHEHQLKKQLKKYEKYIKDKQKTP